MRVFVGGIIPAQDIAELKQLGVAEVFLPGASTEDVVRASRTRLRAADRGPRAMPLTR